MFVCVCVRTRTRVCVSLVVTPRFAGTESMFIPPSPPPPNPRTRFSPQATGVEDNVVAPVINHWVFHAAFKTLALVNCVLLCWIAPSMPVSPAASGLFTAHGFFSGVQPVCVAS